MKDVALIIPVFFFPRIMPVLRANNTFFLSLPLHPIYTTGLQSILFTVVWRALSESTYFKTMVEPNYEDDDGRSFGISLFAKSTWGESKMIHK